MLGHLKGSYFVTFSELIPPRREEGGKKTFATFVVNSLIFF